MGEDCVVEIESHWPNRLRAGERA